MFVLFLVLPLILGGNIKLLRPCDFRKDILISHKIFRLKFTKFIGNDIIFFFSPETSSVIYICVYIYTHTRGRKNVPFVAIALCSAYNIIRIYIMTSYTYESRKTVLCMAYQLSGIPANAIVYMYNARIPHNIYRAPYHPGFLPQCFSRGRTHRRAFYYDNNM